MAGVLVDRGWVVIYVASSWRNAEQPALVSMLREVGHEVYDFRQPEEGNAGFHWSDVYGRPGDAATWAEGVPAGEMIRGLAHPAAVAGFGLDIAAMEKCDTCVLVLPCGRSAHLELGWFVGQGRRTAIVLDDPCQPELMYRMVDFITPNPQELLRWLGGPVRTCRGCGCTDDYGCDGGCWWVSADLCSECQRATLAELARARGRR